jgi:hypothetical protein
MVSGSEVPRLNYSLSAYSPNDGQIWVEYAGKQYHVHMADILRLTPRLESSELSFFVEANWWRYVTLDDGHTVMRHPGPWPKGLKGPMKPPMGRLATASEVGRHHRMHPDTRPAKAKHEEYIAGEHVHQHPFEHQKDPEESAFVVDWHACIHEVVERIDPNRDYPSGWTDSESSSGDEDEGEEGDKENVGAVSNRAQHAPYRNALRDAERNARRMRRQLAYAEGIFFH